jgi:hypothetical protein
VSAFKNGTQPADTYSERHVALEPHIHKGLLDERRIVLPSSMLELELGPVRNALMEASG